MVVVTPGLLDLGKRLLGASKVAFLQRIGQGRERVLRSVPLAILRGRGSLRSILL